MDLLDVKFCFNGEKTGFIIYIIHLKIHAPYTAVS